MLTKDSVRDISRDINAAIQSVAKKHGIKLSMNGGTYQSSNAVLKIKVSTISESGIVETKERISYIQNHKLYDLKREWLDQTFTNGGFVYKIIGLNTRAYKRPVLCERNDGKVYKLSAENVRMWINLQ